MGERPDLAGRVAWTYLATVLAGALGGLLALIAYQIVNPLACPVVDEEAADLALTCSLAWGAGLTLAGFAAAFFGALILLKLERRLAAWLAMLAGLLWLAVGLDGIGQWWWIALLALLPALAALASAPWWAEARPRIAQTATLGAVCLAAVGTLIYQFLAS